MTTTPTAVDPDELGKVVRAALRAIDRAALAPMLESGHAARLAGPLGLVAAGATLSDEQVRDAARVLHAAADRIGPPLAAMGVQVPAAPPPVTREPVTARQRDAARPAMIVGADGRILVESAFDLRDTMKAIPGAQVVPAEIRRRGFRAGKRADGTPRRFHPSWSYPATPASAAALIYTLRVFDPEVARNVRALAEAHFTAKSAKERLVDETVPLPDDTPDGTDEVTMPLWEHQRRMVAIGESTTAMLAAVPMGGGKALDLDTPIATPTGWTRMGDLADGDTVFDQRGEPCRVVRAHDVLHGRDCYEVEFSDGETLVADAEHLWWTLTRSDREKLTYHRARGTLPPPLGGVRTTEEIRDSLRVGARDLTNHSVPVTDPIALPDAELPCPPYVLGAWLGDGCTTGGQITTDDGDDMRRLIEAEGLECGPNYARPDRTETFSVYGIRALLRAAGVFGDKHVPALYLRSSEKQRRALLAGLLDTDGTVCGHGRVQFDSTREALAEDVRELAVSLGYRATIRSKIARFDGRDCGRVWRVSFTSSDALFRLPRKVAAHDARSGAYTASRNDQRYIVAVRSVPSRPVRCITVDSPSRLYLAGRAMIPTHNTSATIALVNRRGWRRVLIVAPNRVRAVWTREVRERSVVDWHIEDGTRPSRRRGGKPQDLGLDERLSRAEFLLDDCTCGAVVHAFVVNYEALLSEQWQSWAPSEPLDAIIYDEAHRLKSYLMYPERSGSKMGPEQRKLGPKATPEQKAAARRLDAMGPTERALRANSDEPSRGELQAARAKDKLIAKAATEAEAKRLTISGQASRWVAISRFRLGLTGTPFPQHPWDIFGIMRALDPGVFGELWTPFQKYYLQMDDSGNFPVRVRKERLAEFARRAMSLMYRPVVDLDLPAVTDVVRTVYLEPAARRAYDELESELETDLRRFLEGEAPAGQGVALDSDDVSAAEVEGAEAVAADVEGEGTLLTGRSLLSMLLRLQQLTGGTLQANDDTGPHGERIPGPRARVSTVKIDQLGRLRKLTAKQARERGHTHELVGGDLFDVGCLPGRVDVDGAPVAPEPVIVYCRFKADLDMVEELCVAAGLRYGEISGRGGKPDGLNADARMSEHIDVVGVQIQAGGTGIDLTRAAVGIWYSLGYSVSDYDQARARPHRPGQTRPVRFIHYVAAKTKDEAVYAAIEQRKSAVAEVLRAAGIDPSALGIEDGGHGADPNAAPAGGRDNARSAVPLPWENDQNDRR